MERKFTGMFENALEYAMQKHKGQYRKRSNMPYLWHTISVAKNIEETKESTNMELLMVASVLHDTVEDCEDVTLAQIAELFGHKVAAIVEELTSDEEKIAEIGKTEYLKQKMEHMSSYSLLIKLSDRYDNIKDIHKQPKEFQERYTKETVDIINHIESCGRKLTESHKILIQKIKKLLIEKKMVESSIFLFID